MKIVIHGTKTVTVRTEKTVSAAQLLRENGFVLSMPCGGNHTCGKCRIRVTGCVSPVSERERALLGAAGKDVRLACFTQLTGDCELFLSENPEKIISDGFLSKFVFAPMGRRYGFAADIGTTTVAVYLYDLKTGEKLRETAFANPQCMFGGDVISRIEASRQGNAARLQALIGGRLAEAFSGLCEACGILPESIDAAVVTGNTTMLYLLLEKDVSCLAAAPFEITDYLGRTVSAGDCGITGFPALPVYLPPTMSSFVGSDITCSVLSAHDLLASPRASVLIDIGTNGEMALKKGEKMFCCSTAAGPAFEGAGITMGSMAVSGAINKVWLADNEIRYSVIGAGKANGICGSGLIDAVAAFVRCGLIDESGCIDDCSAAFARYLGEYDGQTALKIGDSGVVLTQKDVRAVQLAKSAVRAGMESLFHASGMTAAQMDSLILAGGFGSYINAESAGVIGLIPAQLVAKAKAVGNAAGMGASAILLSGKARETALSLAASAETLELSTSAFFMDAYVENMMFGAPE